MLGQSRPSDASLPASATATGEDRRNSSGALVHRSGSLVEILRGHSNTRVPHAQASELEERGPRPRLGLLVRWRGSPAQPDRTAREHGDLAMALLRNHSQVTASANWSAGKRGRSQLEEALTLPGRGGRLNSTADDGSPRCGPLIPVSRHDGAAGLGFTEARPANSPWRR